MPVNLSPLAGAAQQFFDNNGVILSGGKIYTYAAGTTTPLATYTSSSGGTAHANPIVLDSAGRVPGGEIWLTSGSAYKFVVETSTSIVLGTYDDISGSSAANAYLIPSGYTTATTVQDAFDDLGSATGADFVGFSAGGPNPSSRPALDKLRETVSPQDYGAVANGVANDATAFTVADAASDCIHVPAGDYLIGSSITLSSQITFDAGAKLLIGNGVTVTFNGQVISGLYQIFQCTGTGEVVFDWRFTSEGYPEWWGAASDGATDCLAAIHACLKALKVTRLQPGDYFVSNTVQIVYDHRWLVGSGSQYSGVADQVTRLLVTNGSSYALSIGPGSNPGSINLFQKQNIVRDIQVSRTVAPVIASYCAGVNCQFTLYAELHNVKAEEHIAGFRFYGTVYLKCYDCASVRATAGTGPGTDTWYGYYYDGTASIGAAGGNASVYTNYCSAGCNINSLSTGASYGFYMNEGFTDLFFESPETVSCNIGMMVQGNAPSGSPPSNLDLQIKNPIHDAFYGHGTYFKNINKYGSAQLIGGYHGPNAAAASCVRIENCDGSVVITGGQIPMWSATTTNGLDIDGSKGVVVDRVQFLEPTQYGVVMVNSDSCDVRPIVKNYLNALGQGAVTLIGCERNTIAPIVYGSASAVVSGINAGGSANLYNEFNCTGIDSATVGTSAAKLIINGTPVTTTGLSGTNLVSGVMA